MRTRLLAFIFMAGLAAPTLAQQPSVDRRVGKLESEMRAVQRKVFPGGNVEPEIRPQIGIVPVGGDPASSGIADLTARVDALEAQLANLTGQTEENSNRMRLLEEGLGRLRGETDGRFKALEAAAAPPPVVTPRIEEPAPTPRPAATGEPASASGDPGEDAYTVGFRLWEAGKFAEAQKALEAMAKKYPKHKRASYAANLAGRAYLDEGKPATAAKVLLANYQNAPTGERAPDSLYFLGQALIKLNKLPEACKVYEELQDVYGTTMRDWVKTRLPKARADAKCS